jgi:tetratricopeptide (TPR) repeat protein
VLFDKVFELNGNSVLDGTLVPYMETIRVNKLKVKDNPIADDEIMKRYEKIMSVIDAKIGKAQNEQRPIDKYLSFKDQITDILVRIVKIDCDFVKVNLAPKFKQNPNDLVLAKQIFTFMLQGKCTDDPLWLETGTAIHEKTPPPQRDCGLAKNLGIKYMALENYERAEQLFKEALILCKNASDKADVLIYLGMLEVRKGNNPAAREFFLQAGTKAAFEKIGDLYYNSFDDCAKKAIQADDRLVYLIAYDFYQKGGATDKMALAKKQFPSRDEIFLPDYRIGQTMKVGCWINENTVIRARD